MLKSVRAWSAGIRTPRVLFFTHANGAPGGWTPSGGETDFVLSPALKSFEPIRKEILILKNLTMLTGPGNAHRAARVAGLTGTPAQDSQALIPYGPSIDQVLADQLRGQTPFPSLELGIQREGVNGGVGATAGVAVNFSTGSAQPIRLPMILSPVEAYTKLVGKIGGTPSGGGMTSEDAARRLAIRKSVLDFSVADIQTLQRRLGSIEKNRLDALLTAFRNYETTLVTTSNPSGGNACSPGAAPPGAGTSWPATSRAQLDNAAMAFACGLTRVITVCWGGSQNDQGIDFVPPNSGSWHGTSHSQSPFMTAMENYLAGEFVYMVEKMRAMGGQALIDDSLLIYTTQNGNSQTHSQANTPWILTGGFTGKVRTGRMIDVGAKHQNDLFVSIANVMGLPITTFGEKSWCSGPMPGLV